MVVGVGRCVGACGCAYTHVRVDGCMRVHVCIIIWVVVCVCIYARAHVCLYVCVFVCL